MEKNVEESSLEGMLKAGWKITYSWGDGDLKFLERNKERVAYCVSKKEVWIREKNGHIELV